MKVLHLSVPPVDLQNISAYACVNVLTGCSPSPSLFVSSVSQAAAGSEAESWQGLTFRLQTKHLLSSLPGHKIGCRSGSRVREEAPVLSEDMQI